MPRPGRSRARSSIWSRTPPRLRAGDPSAEPSDARRGWRSCLRPCHRWWPPAAPRRRDGRREPTAADRAGRHADQRRGGSALEPHDPPRHAAAGQRRHRRAFARHPEAGVVVHAGGSGDGQPGCRSRRRAAHARGTRRRIRRSHRRPAHGHRGRRSPGRRRDRLHRPADPRAERPQPRRPDVRRRDRHHAALRRRGRAPPRRRTSGFPHAALHLGGARFGGVFGMRLGAGEGAGRRLAGDRRADSLGEPGHARTASSTSMPASSCWECRRSGPSGWSTFPRAATCRGRRACGRSRRRPRISPEAVEALAVELDRQLQSLRLPQQAAH